MTGVKNYESFILSLCVLSDVSESKIRYWYSVSDLIKQSKVIPEYMERVELEHEVHFWHL